MAERKDDTLDAAWELSQRSAQDPDRGGETDQEFPTAGSAQTSLEVRFILLLPQLQLEL